MEKTTITHCPVFLKLASVSLVNKGNELASLIAQFSQSLKVYPKLTVGET